MEGFKYDDSDINIHLDYINVPIVLNYYVTKDFALKAGLQPGFNVRHVATNGSNSVDVSSVAGIAGSKVNTLNLSIPIGLNWETKNLVFDFRYHIGLTEIFDKSGEGYNSTFSFTVGYRL